MTFTGNFIIAAAYSGINACLKDGTWPLLNADLTTPLRHAPRMPLTTLEKRWLKTLLQDPRIRLFDVPAAGLEDAAYYPDPRSKAAREGLAAHVGVAPECLLPTNGGVEAAVIAARLSVRHAVLQPTFQEYARLCGGHRDVEWEKRADFIPEPGECLWLCNPNNPTGAALSREDVLSLLARVEAAGGRLVVDEAFVDYCPECSVADLVAERPALIVLGSLTKSLAIPGVRLGYLAAHPSAIAALEAALPPWRLNCAAEAVAAALPGHEADFERIRAANARRRARFARDLARLGARVYPGAANFLLADFHRDMRPAIEALRERRILLRPCGAFPGLTHAHVRFAVRTEGENERVVEELRRVNRQ